MHWTKGQHVEHGTWWDRDGDPPQEVLDARARHGLNPDGSPCRDVLEVVYDDKLYDVARSALTNPRGYGLVKLETSGPEGSEVSGAPSGVGVSGLKTKSAKG